MDAALRSCFVIFSVGLLQFFMVVFTILRTGEIANLTLLSKYTLILFVLTINIFTAQVWASTCKKLSPIKYVDDLYNEEIEDDFKTEYLPDTPLRTGKLTDQCSSKNNRFKTDIFRHSDF